MHTINRLLSLFVAYALVASSCKTNVTDNSRTPADATSSDSQSAGPQQGDSNKNASGNKLVMVNGEVVMQGGACAALYVQLQNSNGDTVASTATTSLEASSSSGTGEFFTDESCATAGKTVSLASGASDATLYYKDSTVGTANITVAGAAEMGKATGNVVIGTAKKLAFLGNEIKQTATECGFVVVEVQTEAGVSISLAATTAISLSSNVATGKFYSDEACTTAITSVEIPKGTSVSGAFYFKDSTVGPSTLTATESPSQSWTAGSIAATVSN